MWQYVTYFNHTETVKRRKLVHLTELKQHSNNNRLLLSWVLLLPWLVYSSFHTLQIERGQRNITLRDNTNEKPKTKGQHYRKDNEIATKTATELKKTKQKQTSNQWMMQQSATLTLYINIFLWVHDVSNCCPWASGALKQHCPCHVFSTFRGKIVWSHGITQVLDTSSHLKHERLSQAAQSLMAIFTCKVTVLYFVY